MEKIVINTKRAPKVIGPYSQAIKFGNLVFTSGQIPIDPLTQEMVEKNIEIQTRRVFDNIKEILDAAGSSLKDVLKVTIYLTDLNHYNIVNEIYGLYFNSYRPARTLVEVKALPKGALIEVDAVAKAD